MRPRLIMQMAHSADGYIARPNERTTLTSRAGWSAVYEDRAHADAVMVGITTVLMDDPVLSAHGHGKNPIRIVADTHARLPLNSQFALTAHKTPTWLLTTKFHDDALADLGVRLITCPMKDGRVDINIGLKKLENIKLVICEGGATLAQTMNTEGLIDELNLIEARETNLVHGIRLPVFTDFSFVSETILETDTWRHYVRKKEN